MNIFEQRRERYSELMSSIARLVDEIGMWTLNPTEYLTAPEFVDNVTEHQLESAAPCAERPKRWTIPRRYGPEVMLRSFSGSWSSRGSLVDPNTDHIHLEACGHGASDRESSARTSCCSRDTGTRRRGQSAALSDENPVAMLSAAAYFRTLSCDLVEMAVAAPTVGRKQ